MYCRECGQKLTLRYCENEGLIPYCAKCADYMFPQFSIAVSMVVTNRAQDKILLAKHVEDDDFILFAGYVKKGESAEKTIPREIKEELDFRQMERANDTELGESVLVDYFLGSILEEQDLINFIGWFYSAKELKRYTFKAWRKLGKVNVEDYIIDFLLRCSMPLRSYIINTYGHLLPRFQFMFMELFKEMYRRMELFPTPKGNSYIKANEELKKIVKRLKKKTTEEEFIESRVIPILEREEKARIKNFQKIYGKHA